MSELSPIFKSQETQVQQLQELMELFSDNIAQYKGSNYDEANTRVDFIDKFFEILGWDVRNTNGFAEKYRDVVREDRVVIDNRPKAPDYAFRIGGYTKFFVEAKKPSVNIKEEIVPAFQLRRYGYTAKLALSILTDFEEFAVYDTRFKPDMHDKASKARIFYCRFDQYLKKCEFDGFGTNFDYIVGTFSKTAILKGSFDRYIESTKNKRGTSEVDQELLTLIEHWRLELAKTVAKTNPNLDIYHLNVAVQRIIDRILFLRIAEDRRIERYGNLLKVAEKNDIYQNIQTLFDDANEKYNAGLFRSDAKLNALLVEDKILAPIIKGLYYPQSPYEFSVLPIEILGSIYERFLGKTIRLTESHQAKVEEKPEVRKAGGVYYTPQYIVDYIIQETLGRKVSGRKPKDVEKLRVLDPACGSGSFLVGAYTFLLDWHQSYYEHDANRKTALRKGYIYEFGEKTYRLSIEEKQRILLNNIYGVDIDPIAVEVTKLSLYLKLLENETEESRELLFRHSDLKMLPNLDNNIQCGNSLVESDFYMGRQLDLFTNDAMRKVNAFDWKTVFVSIMRSGGFDVVVGNPPYVRQETLDEDSKTYYQTHYEVYQGTADLYVYFLEKGHRLLKPGGMYGVICSNKFVRSNYGTKIRQFLKENATIIQLVDFGELPVFGASTFPMIVVTNKEKCEEQSFRFTMIKSLDFKSVHEVVQNSGRVLSHTAIEGDIWRLTGDRNVSIFNKLMEKGIPLKDYVQDKIYYGIKTGLNDAFVIDTATRDRMIQEDPRSEEIIKPFLAGRDIRRYAPLKTNKWLIMIPKGFTNEKGNGPRGAWKWFSTNYPAIAAHLEPFMKKAKKRCDQGDYWWELRACDYYNELEQPKIVLPDIAKESRMSFDRDGVYLGNTAYFISIDDLYLLSILNSALIFFYFKSNASVLGDADKGGRLRWFMQDVIKLPIIVPSSKEEHHIHDRLVNLVEQMLKAQTDRSTAYSDSDRKLQEQRIFILDREINSLVYRLYGLTDEEIEIISGES